MPGSTPRWTPVLLLLVLTSAGCFSPAPAQAGPVLAAADEMQSAMRVLTIVDPEGGTGEPSLGVTPEGILFTNSRAGTYRSEDGGLTWQLLGNPTRPFPNFDPDLAVDADGTVWYDTLYLACNAVAVSRDDGESWTRHPAVCNGPVGDRQYVIPTAGGEAVLYYHQIPTFQHTAMRTTDHGRTWLATGPMETLDHHLLLTGGSGWGGGGFWNRAHDSIWATYTWFDTPQSREPDPRGEEEWWPAASVTYDRMTWQPVRGPAPGGRTVGLGLLVGAADDAGRVYLAWTELRDGPSGVDDVAVMMSASRDGGASWSRPTRVDDGSGSHVFPAIAAGPEGAVAIAYYEADVDGHPYDVGADATWTVTLASTRDALSPSPRWSRMQASADIVKHGAICPHGGPCDRDREFLDYFRIARLPDGRVGLAYNLLEPHAEDPLTVFGKTEARLLH